MVVKLQGCLRPVLQHAEKKMNKFHTQIFIIIYAFNRIIIESKVIFKMFARFIKY
jgi:hypothetical protein